MNSLKLSELSIDVVETPESTFQCTWRGKSYERNAADTLSAWLDALLATAVAKGGAIEMHFEDIEHFNASTITVLVRHIQACRAQKVKLTMVYNGALNWQSLSFDALRIFVMRDDLFTLRPA
ncbi:MAG TPA: hypothetical protein VFV99_29185 [Kofleriaceae bacterium]|nr:hypothetical protein [Kofleriaceae bacterium]